MARKKRQKKLQAVKSDKAIIKDVAIRYLLLLLVSVNGLWLFYFLFTKLTLYTSAFLINFFYSAKVYSNALLVEGQIVSIIKACIAGAAYYLLLILNLTTAGIKAKKRILIFLFDALLLLALNAVRIAVLAFMVVKNFASFDITHRVFWYGISTIYVVFIWILTIKIFKIKEIPVYSDFSFAVKEMKVSKKKIAVRKKP
jgi:exosortase/archaeosortase family protein